MTTTKAGLMASVAVLALGLTWTASPVQAFDNVKWNWNQRVHSDIDVDIDVHSSIDPSGFVNIEKLQLQIGDVTAESTVHNFRNIPAVGPSQGGTVMIDEIFEFRTTYDDSVNPAPIAPVDGVNVGDDGSPVEAALLEGGIVREGSDRLKFQVQVTGEVAVPPGLGGGLDAEVELPQVLSTATAVGNNQSIDSDVAVQLHDAQILFDVAEGGVDEMDPEVDMTGTSGGLFSGNTHTDIALSAALAAITGVVGKAEITATSDVKHILNASVESSATAVGNNFSLALEPAFANDADSFLVADLTQASIADVSATSTVNRVKIDGYYNMGIEGINPAISSVATAVGNNVNISVGVPSVAE